MLCRHCCIPYEVPVFFEQHAHHKESVMYILPAYLLTYLQTLFYFQWMVLAADPLKCRMTTDLVSHQEVSSHEVIPLHPFNHFITCLFNCSVTLS